MVLGIILAIIVVLVIAAIMLYNNLVKMRNMVDNAWAQIDVQLQRRCDLIPNLVETVKATPRMSRARLRRSSLRVRPLPTQRLPRRKWKPIML